MKFIAALRRSQWLYC